MQFLVSRTYSFGGDRWSSLGCCTPTRNLLPCSRWFTLRSTSQGDSCRSVSVHLNNRLFGMTASLTGSVFLIPHGSHRNTRCTSALIRTGRWAKMFPEIVPCLSDCSTNSLESDRGPHNSTDLIVRIDKRGGQRRNVDWISNWLVSRAVYHISTRF